MMLRLAHRLPFSSTSTAANRRQQDVRAVLQLRAKTERAGSDTVQALRTQPSTMCAPGVLLLLS